MRDCQKLVVNYFKSGSSTESKTKEGGQLVKAR